MSSVVDLDGYTVVFSTHARDQWRDRIVAHYPRAPTIGAAWDAGLDVEIDGITGGSRLHIGTESALVHVDHDHHDDTRIVSTVLYVEPAQMARYCNHCPVCDSWVPLSDESLLLRCADPSAPVTDEPRRCPACASEVVACE